MDWPTTIPMAWTYFFAVVTLLGAVAASVHAVLYKRDSRAAILWVGFIWLAPLAGSIFYLLFGINRIRRRATLLRGAERRTIGPPADGVEVEPEITPHTRQLANLARLVGSVTNLPLTRSNRIVPLVTGDEAYPAMLEAIESARVSITLATYIFDRDSVGLRFVDALKSAVERNVEVRVLVDAAGARYSLPSIVRVLEKANIRVARFLPTLVPLKNITINLRNHRKILVVDGSIGFTGGMNIREGNCTDPDRGLRIRDTHFRIQGPLVSQMQAVFANDWQFTTGEALKGHPWFTNPKRAGGVLARGIVDGPDDDLGKLRWTLLAGLSAAHDTVRVVTPYFLPDQALISELNLAAMRGVKVDIVMPEKNNLRIVHWAAMAHLWQVLQRGCRVWFTPGVFDHSKIFVVDGHWSMIGSANWDPRSLRLNFEYNVECYDAKFGARLDQMIDARIADSRQITLEHVDGRSLPVRLRDGVARLLTPLL
jgi:cardiolipin synthase